MKNYLQHGDTLDLTAPSGGVVSGSPVLIGGQLVVPCVSAAEGAVFAAKTTGVFQFVAEGAGSGQAWAEGETVYWDDANKRFTKTASGNTKRGHAVAAKLTADVVGSVKLIPTL